MNKLNPSHDTKSTPPPRFLPVLLKLKTAYHLWFECLNALPKSHRYSLGQRIDTILIEAIESISVASFLNREEKLPYVRVAIRKMDTAKVLLLILWETKSLDNKKYVALSGPLDEIGRMLGGWFGQLSKQNSPTG